MNDSPVDCQNREWTEPQRDKGDRRTAVDEVFWGGSKIVLIIIFVAPFENGCRHSSKKGE